MDVTPKFYEGCETVHYLLLKNTTTPITSVFRTDRKDFSYSFLEEISNDAVMFSLVTILLQSPVCLGECTIVLSLRVNRTIPAIFCPVCKYNMHYNAFTYTQW